MNPLELDESSQIFIENPLELDESSQIFIENPMPLPLYYQVGSGFKVHIFQFLFSIYKITFFCRSLFNIY